MGAASAGLPTGATVIDSRRIGVADDGTFRLLGIRCQSCGALSHPVRRHCPLCGGPADAIQLGTSGRVLAATVARTARAELLIKPPYQVVLAQLTDGPVLKLPSLEDAAFRIGDAIVVEPLVLESAKGLVAAMQARHATSSHD